MNQPNFFDSNTLREIKVFQIDKNFYELRRIGSNEEIVNFIIDQHRIKVGNTDQVGDRLPQTVQDGVTYYSYVYNEELREAYWQRFLPNAITQHHNFEVQRLSFVLFAVVNSQIFAIIGGGGIRVIKRYVNFRFGIELFEHFTIPAQDIINSITTRSISGYLVGGQNNYRVGQTLIDALSFNHIPTKINAILRDDVKDTLFDFIHFHADNVFIEVGSYFHLKHKFSFHQLHQLFSRMEEVMGGDDIYPLSTFERVRDPEKTDKQYIAILIERIKGDMVDRFYEFRSGRMMKFDIDFIHPSKMKEYYECDRFELIARNCLNPFFETYDRTKLYEGGLKYMYEKFGAGVENYEFGKFLLGVRVHGYREDALLTKATFIQHLTCEIKHYNSPVFKIDKYWYKVKTNFVDTINNQCISYLESNRLASGILKVFWNKKETEGSYNSRYDGLDGYLVFDKVLGNNIEFCDVMFENEDNIYLIHVKDGFDAKMRDLSNQILISANRFKTDIESNDPQFLTEIVTKYNAKNNIQLDLEQFIQKFRSGKTVHYVLAYRSHYNIISDVDRITRSNSNIAKYSLISCFKEMASLYPLKVYDIANVETDSLTINIETIVNGLKIAR